MNDITFILAKVKRFFLPVFLLITALASSQQELSKELSLTLDNDLFVSREKDRYYSSGVTIAHRYFKPNVGKIIEFEIGQQIYTPYKSILSDKKLHDRPFAGYLYGSLGVIAMSNDHTVFKNSIQFGIVGQGALGKQLQEFVHSIYNFERPEGWKYQIENTLAINFDSELYTLLATNNSNYFDISFLAKIKTGTIFNDLSIGFMGRIGLTKLQDLNHSIALNTHLNNHDNSLSRGREFFLYYETLFSYVAYDATIQGSLFDNASPVTFTPIPFRFDLELGCKFAVKRWNFGYAYHFHSNKINGLQNDKGNDYGRLFLSYLLD